MTEQKKMNAERGRLRRGTNPKCGRVTTTRAPAIPPLTRSLITGITEIWARKERGVAGKPVPPLDSGSSSHD